MDQSLRIAIVAHVRHPISQPFMGGMEAHAYHLAKWLTEAGHDVTVFAAGDSDVPGRLVPILDEHYDRRYPWHVYRGTETLTNLLDDGFGRILPALKEFDVVHNNSLHRYPPRLSRRDRIPMVTSLHIPPFRALREAIDGSAAPWCGLTVCSKRQRKIWWPERAPASAQVLYNGIDADRFPFRATGNGRAVWAGRITPTKGTHLAVGAAQRAGIGLSIFGTIEDSDYFEEQVRPSIDREICYEGHGDMEALAAAMAEASVLLFTPLWEEPFGLVAAEAMACGVPVAALPNGAASEIVGAGGVMARDATADALASALVAALAFDRRRVREWARLRYGKDRMVEECVAMYRKVIAAKNAILPPVRFEEHELPGAVLETAASEQHRAQGSSGRICFGRVRPVLAQIGRNAL